MTLWEFEAAWAGWRRANTVKEEDEAAPAMSDERLAELGIVGFN